MKPPHSKWRRPARSGFGCCTSSRLERVHELARGAARAARRARSSAVDRRFAARPTRMVVVVRQSRRAREPARQCTVRESERSVCTWRACGAASRRSGCQRSRRRGAGRRAGEAGPAGAPAARRGAARAVEAAGRIASRSRKDALSSAVSLDARAFERRREAGRTLPGCIAGGRRGAHARCGRRQLADLGASPPGCERLGGAVARVAAVVAPLGPRFSRFGDLAISASGDGVGDGVGPPSSGGFFAAVVQGRRASAAAGFAVAHRRAQAGGCRKRLAAGRGGSACCWALRIRRP